MVSFKRISSLLCVCAIFCCFIGLAMPVSAAGNDLDLFSDAVFEFMSTDENPDLGTLYLYRCLSVSLSFEEIENFGSSLGESLMCFFKIDSAYFEVYPIEFTDDSIVLSSIGGLPPLLSITRETIGGPFDFCTFVSTEDLGSSFTLSVTNYVQNSDPAFSGFLGDLGDVASSSLSLVSSVVSTIVNNPFLLLTVGFFFAGAAVAILGRILGKS